MKIPSFRKVALASLSIVAAFYAGLIVVNSKNSLPTSNYDMNTQPRYTVAIFGATGTIGDGLLKAAINDPLVEKIHVVTRRLSPRIEEGLASGRVVVHIHEDPSPFGPGASS